LWNLENYWQKAALKVKRYVSSTQARKLERELASARDEKQSLLSELPNVHTELDGIRSRNKEELNKLEQRIGSIESERESAHQQIQTLRNSLTEAASRLDSWETRVNLLDTQMEEERRKHQSELQEAQDRTRQQERRLNWVVMVAGVAFLLGVVASVTNIRDTRNNARLMAELNRDIKASMEQQLGSMRESLEEYQREKSNGQALYTEPAVAGNQERPTGLTATETVTDSSAYAHHPHNKHRTKPEMKAFFEENARELGVISLASGLQYKILSHGSGKSPKTTDRVVFDYRAFLSDGTELYNSYNEPEPVAFSFDQVMPGLQEALLRMEEGAQWELYIPPALAYRKGTRKRGKYGYEPLIYVVELKSVIEGGQSIEN
jgi:FKBP-type peptidyl-prolyl cis-trans isomerase/archaellum component FlaC